MMYSHNHFQVQVIGDMSEAAHLHPDVELLYVLEGEVYVTIHETVYLMKTDDVLLINSSVRHSVCADTKNILCRVAYDYQVLAELIRDGNGMFLCNSTVDQEKSYEKLQLLLRELVYEELLYSHRSESFKYSLLYQILDQLIENFMAEHAGGRLRKDDRQDDEKLQEIIRYVYQNFQEVVSLSALAEQMYVSKSTLSRFFKKQTGIYFAEYVNQIRLNYAVQELLYSERNITKIAMECGFSNTSVFDKVFRENYGMSPSEYRVIMCAKVNDEQKQRESVREQMREELKEKIGIPKETKAPDSKNIEINAQETHTLKKNWNQVINIGSAHSLTLANVQYHLLYLVEQLGFSYARIWSVFDKRLMICDGSSIGVYNYDALDSVLDFLVSHHIIPFLDLGRRPSTAVRSAGDAVYYREEGIEFKSRRAWEALFEDFFQHILRRYGKREVGRWIFELSRDPTHEESGKYYEESGYHIFHVYRFVYKTIKKTLPEARIGGFGGLADADGRLALQLLELSKKENCMPDFLSFILFPYIPEQSSSDTNQRPYKRSPSREFEMQQIGLMRRIMQQAGQENCKLYITEWNNTISNRNYLNDSCFRGTYLCKKVSEILDSVDLLCVWMGSDWVSSYYDSYGIVNGGSGLLTKDGIRKPAFYAMQFLNQLGDELVATGEHYIVTKSRSGSYRILCFHCQWYHIRYFLKAENAIQPHELDRIFPENEPLSVNMILNHMQDGETYIIKKKSVSGKDGSILDEWEKFQFETHLERADVKYLQEICIPQLGMEKKKAEGGRLYLHIQLEKHEFALYHIYMENK